jgi:hypothetical protein
VIDAETADPIPEFVAIPGYHYGNIGRPWYRSDLVHGTNGNFNLEFNEPSRPFRLRVEAAGYESAISEEIPPDLTKTNLTIELQRQDETNAIHGIVYLPDGSPAAGADVALGTLESRIELGFAKFVHRETEITTLADDRGRFRFSPEKFAHTVIAVRNEGIAISTLQGVERPLKLHLQPWGRVEGKVLGTSSFKDQFAWIMNPATIQYKGGLQFALDTFRIPIKSDGTFVFQKVPPGVLNLRRSVKVGIETDETWVQVESGKTKKVELGVPRGRKIIGRFVPENRLEGQTMAPVINVFSQKTAPVQPPKGLGEADEAFWSVAFWNSSAGLEYLINYKTYDLDLAPDGSFQIDQVTSGEYYLSVTVELRKENTNSKRATFYREINVPPGDEAIDLGNLVLTAQR